MHIWCRHLTEYWSLLIMEERNLPNRGSLMASATRHLWHWNIFIMVFFYYCVKKTHFSNAREYLHLYTRHWQVYNRTKREREREKNHFNLLFDGKSGHILLCFRKRKILIWNLFPLMKWMHRTCLNIENWYNLTRQLQIISFIWYNSVEH